MGGHASAYFGRGRATTDVDLLVSRCFVEKIKAELEQRGYVVAEFRYLLKVYDRGDPTSLCDLVMQETNSVLRAAFLATTPAVILGLPVNVVRRGALVALKFQAATDRRRKSKDKLRDVMDIRAILQNGFGAPDKRLALELAAQMYPRAPADLESLIAALSNGRWPRVVRRTSGGSRWLLRRR